MILDFNNSNEVFKDLANKCILGIILIQGKKIIYFNDAIVNLTGYSFKEIINWDYEDWLNRIHPEDLSLVIEETRLIFEGDKELTSFRIITESEKIKYLDFYGKLIYINGKKAIMVSIVDITIRILREIKLKESEEKYCEIYNLSNFYKDLFIHDMSNILQGIISAADCYRLFKDDPEKMKSLGDFSQLIKNHAMRGSTLVSNVRKLSKLDEIEMSFKPIEVSTTLNKAVNNLKSGFHERDVEVNITGLFKDSFVLGNDLLIDVFDNLLNNAVKYTIEKDKVNIKVSISKVLEDEVSYLKFEFIDHGIGVPDEKKSILFQRQPTEEICERGMGIGLSLVKKIVDKYGGSIWMEDRVKGDYAKGSKFIIMLKEL